MSVVIRWEVGVKELAGVLWWSEDIARLGYVFLAHHNLKARARPCKVFAHSSRGVTLDHCLNAGTFERALGQVRLRAGTVLLDDDKLGVVHSSIVRPDERERGSLRVSGGASRLPSMIEASRVHRGHFRRRWTVWRKWISSKSGGEPPHSKGRG